MHNLF